MTNKELIEQLEQIGKLPPAQEADASSFPLEEFDGLLEEFEVPVDFETAVRLVNLSPPVHEGCHGLEWAIIHLVETMEEERYQQLLDVSGDGEVKRLLQMRYDHTKHM